MKYGVFFDLDGVLVDTQKANYHSYLSALEQILGSSTISEKFTPQVFTRIWGKSWQEWLGVFAQGSAKKVHELKVSHYPDFLSRYGVILPGLDILEHWCSASIPTAIVSNASADSIEQLMGWLQIRGEFAFLRKIPIICPNQELEPKPNPRIIKKACKVLKVESGILIDDDLTLGERTARRAHISFIHYTPDTDSINKKIKELVL